jgi:hypothetical protein
VKSEDVPTYKWFRLDDSEGSYYDYERYMYKTDIYDGKYTLHLEVYKNEGMTDYGYTYSYLSEPGFWFHYESEHIKDEFPVDENEALKRCLMDFFKQGGAQ